MSGRQAALIAEGVSKRYGPTTALDGFDLAVPAGSVFGLLGPNGAGKTTAVRVFATLTRPDEGRAEVAGVDVVREAALVRTRIGLAGQYAAVDEMLTGRENLRMFGRLSHIGGTAAKRRADDLLERFGLLHAGDRIAGEYSGGMRRRLDLAASLIVSPAILFLDEPTTGLDPAARAEVWTAVRELADAGTTVLLTTQYLDEADRLAGQIAVIDGGRVIATGTPDQLKRQAGGERIEVTVESESALATAAAALASVTGSAVTQDVATRQASAVITGGSKALMDAVRVLDEHRVVTEDIAIRRATLDDVFLQLTGHATGPMIPSQQRSA